MMRKGIVRFTLSAALCIYSRISANWWEELSKANTQTDKARIETEKTSPPPPSGDKANIRYSVSLIEAVLINKDGTVELTWMDTEDTAVKYKIYRYNQVIDSPEKLVKAEFLSSISPGVQKYRDVLKVPGTYFYAVITEVDGNEKPVFMFEQSYTAAAIRFDTEEKVSVVTGLKTIYNKFLGMVFIRWTDPVSDDDFDVLIYRSTEVISSTEILTRAVLIDIVKKGEEKYQDKTIQAGQNYFYAILIKKKNTEQIERILEAGVNYTTEGIAPEDKGSQVIFKNLPVSSALSFDELDNDPRAAHTNADTPKKTEEEVISPKPEFFYTSDLEISYDELSHSIRLLWKVEDDIDRPFYFNIYRTTNVITAIDKLFHFNCILENIPQRIAMKGQKFEYRDAAITTEIPYYYAVLIDNGKGISGQKLLLLDNYIKYPVKIPSKNTTVPNTPQPYRTEIQLREHQTNPNDAAIRSQARRLVLEHFRKKQFQYVIFKLDELASAGNLSDDTLKFIFQYRGRAWLGLNQRNKAMENFRLLYEIDEDTGQFWIEQAVLQ